MFASTFFGDLDFTVLWQYRAALAQGVALTCLLAVLSFVIAIPLACGLAIGKLSRRRVPRASCSVFVEFWRNTPLLVQAFWIHFSLPLLTGVNTSPFVSGMIALTLNNAAYMAEIFRSGIRGVPSGQWEAAVALGLPGWPKWTQIVLPQALKIVVPPLTGFAISVLKGTAIISILAVTELMRISTQINNVTFRPVEIFSFAALVYLVIGGVIYKFGRQVERRLSHSEMR